MHSVVPSQVVGLHVPDVSFVNVALRNLPGLDKLPQPRGGELVRLGRAKAGTLHRGTGGAGNGNHIGVDVHFDFAFSLLFAGSALCGFALRWVPPSVWRDAS
jgi:hypothetical protein